MMRDHDIMSDYEESIAARKRDAASLFQRISDELGADEARAIFEDILKRGRGRRKTTDQANTDAFFVALNRAGATNLTQLATWAYKNKMGHSVPALLTRFRRLGIRADTRPTRRKSKRIARSST